MAITLRNLAFSAIIAVCGLPVCANAWQPAGPRTFLATKNTDTADELFALATGHYEREEWHQAAEKFMLFARSLPGHPQSAAAWFFAGEALLQSGNLADARSAYQHFQILNGRPDLAEKAAFRVAEIASRSGDAQAVRFLEDFLQSYPQSVWREYGLYYLGHKRLARSEPQLARQVLQTALAEFPDSKMTQENLLGIGVACRSTGDIGTARDCFLQVQSDSVGPLRYGAMLQLAGIHVVENDFASAGPLVDELTGADDLPESLAGEAWLLAGTCRAQSEDDELAVECYQKALLLADDDDLAAVATWHLAIALQRLENTDEADNRFLSLIESWPEHRLAVFAAVSLAESSFQKEKWAEVIRYSVAAMAGDLPPEYLSRVSELMGRSQYELKQYADCEVTFEGLLTAYPAANNRARAVWMYFAGSSQIGLSEFAAAVETLQHIELGDLDPEMSDSCRVALATAALGAGEFGLAVSTWRAVARDSKNGEMRQQARQDMLLALARDNNLAEIAEEIDEWWQSESGSGRCIALTRRVARQALAAGDNGLAKKCFEFLATAAGSGPDSRAESISAMGWMELENGNPDQALVYFEQLTGQYPESPLSADCWIAMASIHEQREAWETASWMYGHAANYSPKPSTRHAAMFKQAVMLRKIGTAWSITRGGNILKELAAIEGHQVPEVQLNYELAWFEQHSGQQAASLARFESIANSETDSPVWADSALRVAQRHMQAREFDAARDMLTRLVVDSRTNETILARSHFLLGQIASSSGDWKLAAAEMEQALGKCSDGDLELRCQYWIAECQYRNGDFESAAGSFAKLASEESKFDDSLIPWIWLRMGQSQAQERDWHAVAETVSQTGGRFPDFASNHEFEFLAGRERFAAGMFDDAMAKFGKVIAAPNARGSETAAQAQWMIGEAFFHQEKYKEAIEAFYKVDSLYQSPLWRPAAILQAGKCQEQLGNRNHAAALYTQLVRKFPDSQYVVQANRRLETLNSQHPSRSPPRQPAARTAGHRNPNPVQANTARNTRSNTDARKRP